MPGQIIEITPNKPTIPLSGPVIIGQPCEHCHGTLFRLFEDGKECIRCKQDFPHK